MKSSNDMAPYLFHQGTNYRSFEYMGVHRADGGFYFRVWAPNAERVWVVGTFNDWSDSHEMWKKTDGGIWELFLPEDTVCEGQLYKFKIQGNGRISFKSDPYGFWTKGSPETATVVGDIGMYRWRDDGWLAYRRRQSRDFYARPLNVYELHLGSWKRHADGSFYTYSEIASDLAPYVKQMGYTHVELMPVMEHPFDGSWGYQVCSYYAPSARFGTPTDFMAFVDSMHEAGIGVILDWVPAHFPKDEHGLYEFDGKPLYEYQSPERIEHKGWGTRQFDVGRNEVQSFLISNAMFWIEQYHADGLRVDAVTSMLYLDYDRADGEWTPNIFGNNQCLEAVAFLKKLNSCIKQYHSDVLMIAEESTAWPHVTSFEEGGLGFDLKWNLGWMNDTLSYVPIDPLFRKYHHEKITFSMTYAFSEHFVLPISHDEVVHGKKPLWDKMFGDRWQKFASVRATVGYMMTHPGKKLMFMGNEIGQTTEWNCDAPIPWELLQDEMHAKLQHYMAELNHFYLKTPSLWQIDDSWAGFEWIEPNDRERSIFSYRRTDRDGNELLVLIHFTPMVYENFCLQVPQAGVYEECLNSDSESFGGSGVVNVGDLISKKENEKDVIEIRVPPLGMAMFQRKKENTGL